MYLYFSVYVHSKEEFLTAIRKLDELGIDHDATPDDWGYDKEMMCDTCGETLRQHPYADGKYQVDKLCKALFSD